MRTRECFLLAYVMVLPPRARMPDIGRPQKAQCSVPNQIKWTSKVEGTHIILPRMTLPWHLVAMSFHFIGFEKKIDLFEPRDFGRRTALEKEREWAETLP